MKLFAYIGKKLPGRRFVTQPGHIDTRRSPRETRDPLRFWVTGAIKRFVRFAVAVPSLVLYSAMAPFGYLVFATVAIIPTAHPRRRARRLQWIMRTAFMLMHDWLRWIRILDCNPRQLRGRLPASPCIVIANHPMLCDVTVIMAAVPRLCTLIKPRFYDKPFLTPLLAGAGQFRSCTETLEGTRQTLDMAIGRLHEGYHVLVFPEGARSPRGGLRAFGRGAFEMACRSQTPIVPVLIVADPLWLARGDTVFLPPATLPRVRLEVLPTMHPADFGDDSREMRDAAIALYRRHLFP